MDCAAVMYGAATDSVRLPFFFLLHVKLTSSATKTSCTMRSFFALMSLHPSVMQRAQEDIDRVTEKERLPTFDDWEKLPYINAIIMEVLRYNTVTPLGEHFFFARNGHYFSLAWHWSQVCRIVYPKTISITGCLSPKLR